MKKNSTNDELSLEVQLFIKRWIKEHSDEINKSIIEKTKNK